MSRAFGYIFFLTLSVAILVAGQRLDRADLAAPFEYDDDALLILPLYKSLVETGTPWTIDRLGAPGVHQLYDFPVIDYLHFAGVWLLGRFTDPIVAFNLYHLLTFPFVALTAMLVLRHSDLSMPAAGCGGLLFTFVPYHAFRGEHHYTLAAYYMVPLSLMIALWICRGRLPFFRLDPDGRYRFALFTRDAVVAVAVAAATATGNAYHAFFACALYPVAAIYGSIATRSWRPLVSAGLVTLVVVAGGVLGHLPSIEYQQRNGTNSIPDTRVPAEAEFHGLKLAYLVLPVTNHQSEALAAVRARYDDEDRGEREGEKLWSSLGLVGSVGLLGLLAVSLFSVGRAWPAGPLAALALAAILIGTVGGFGALVATFGTPQVRAYNRLSIFIAFLAIFAVMAAFDRVFIGRPGWQRWSAALALAAFGIWDQCPRPWFRPDAADKRDRAAEQYRADAEFFAKVEAAFPGGAVLTLPFIEFPEHMQKTGFKTGYEPARGFLHTTTVRWSYGAIKGREVDQWQREVSTLPVREMLTRLTLRGFDGVFVDRRGFANPADADRTLTDLRVALSDAFLVHPDGRQFVFDLRPYRAKLRRELGDEFDLIAKNDAETVRVLWLRGFMSHAPVGEEWKHHAGAADGEVAFVNPSDRPRTLRLEMVVRTQWDEPGDLRIDGAVWAERFSVNKDSPLRTATVTVPPGTHVVRFHFRPPAGKTTTSNRRHLYTVALFRTTQFP